MSVTALVLSASALAAEGALLEASFESGLDADLAVGTASSESAEVQSVAGPFGLAAHFGADSWLRYRADDGNLHLADMAVEFWLKTDWDPAAVGERHEIFKVEATDGYVFFRHQEHGGRGQFLFRVQGADGGNYGYFPKPTSWIDGGYNHVMLSWNRFGALVHVNGQRVSAEALPVVPGRLYLPSQPGSFIYVGAESAELGGGARAALDEIRVLDSSVDVDGARALYQRRLYARFDGDPSASLARGDRHATATGLSFEPGAFGQAACLESGGRLTYPALGNLGVEQGTVRFWLRPGWRFDDGRDHPIFEIEHTDGSLLLGKDAVDRLVLRADVEGQHNLGWIPKPWSWIEEGWNLVAVTWSPAGLFLFVNDRLLRVDTPPALPTSPVAIHLGNRAQPGAGLEGCIDEVELFAAALDADTLYRQATVSLGIPFFDVGSGARDIPQPVYLRERSRIELLDAEILPAHQGAALTSPSDRLIAHTVDALRAEAGAVALWLRPSWLYADGVEHVIADLGSDFVLSKTADGVLRLVHGTDEVSCPRPGGWYEQDWNHLAATWGEQLRIYHDGVLCAEIDRQGTAPALRGWSFFGSRADGSALLDGAIDELWLAPRELSRDELGRRAWGSLVGYMYYIKEGETEQEIRSWYAGFAALPFSGILRKTSEWYHGNSGTFLTTVLSPLHAAAVEVGMDRNFIGGDLAAGMPESRVWPAHWTQLELTSGPVRFPDWFDFTAGGDLGWNAVIDNLRGAAEACVNLNQTVGGCAGVLSDIEPYGASWDMWSTDAVVLPPGKSLQDLYDVTFERGRQLGQAVAEVDPELPLFVFPELAFELFDLEPTAPESRDGYPFWRFMQGLLSVEGGGITMAPERFYNLHPGHTFARWQEVRHAYFAFYEAVAESVERGPYWRGRGDVAPAPWLWEEDPAKNALYDSQLAALRSVSQDTVWWYGGPHGLCYLAQSWDTEGRCGTEDEGENPYRTAELSRTTADATRKAAFSVAVADRARRPGFLRGRVHTSTGTGVAGVELTVDSTVLARSNEGGGFTLTWPERLLGPTAPVMVTPLGNGLTFEPASIAWYPTEAVSGLLVVASGTAVDAGHVVDREVVDHEATDLWVVDREVDDREFIDRGAIDREVVDRGSPDRAPEDRPGSTDQVLPPDHGRIDREPTVQPVVADGCGCGQGPPVAGPWPWVLVLLAQMLRTARNTFRGRSLPLSSPPPARAIPSSVATGCCGALRRLSR